MSEEIRQMQVHMSENGGFAWRKDAAVRDLWGHECRLTSEELNVFTRSVHQLEMTWRSATVRRAAYIASGSVDSAVAAQIEANQIEDQLRTKAEEYSRLIEAQLTEKARIDGELRIAESARRKLADASRRELVAADANEQKEQVRERTEGLQRATLQD